MNKSLMGVLSICGLVLVVGIFVFLRQPQKNQEEVLPSSVTQGINKELNEADTVASSDIALEQDADVLATDQNVASTPSASTNLFVSEEAELDTEMSGLQTDMNQLSDQDAETDMKDLEQIQS